MRKYILSFLLCLALTNSTMAQMQISDVRRVGSWYRVYDINGNQIKTLSSSVGVLVGFCAEFIIMENNGWYYLYDSTGRHYKTLSTSIGVVTSVSGGTFTVKKGSWLYVYIKKGEQIAVHTASIKY